MFEKSMRSTMKAEDDALIKKITSSGNFLHDVEHLQCDNTEFVNYMFEKNGRDFKAQFHHRMKRG